MIRSEMDRQRQREEGTTRAELEGYLELIRKAVAAPTDHKTRLQQLLEDQLDAICQEAGLEVEQALALLGGKVKRHVLARGLGFTSPREFLAYFYGWTRHDNAKEILQRYKKVNRYGN